MDSKRHVSRFTFHALWLVLYACYLLLYIGCSQDSEQIEQIPLSWYVTFFPLGAKVHFDANAREPIQRISVFDTKAGPVAQLELGGYSRRAESLYFRWEKGEAYRFEVTTSDGKSMTQTVESPQLERRGSIEIAIPYGTVDIDRPAKAEPLHAKSLVLQGSEMTATVLVRNGLEAPVTFRVELEIPHPVDVSRFPSVWENHVNRTSIRSGTGEEANDTLLAATGKFTVESEVWYSQLGLKISSQQLPPSTHIRGRVIFAAVSGEQWEKSTHIMLRSATIDEMGAQLSIEEVLMPTDVAGIFDPRQRPNAISYRRPLLGEFGRWFGAKDRTIDYFQPMAYQTVHLHNLGQEVIHVIVASINRHPESGKAVTFLAPPDAINAGTNRSLAFVSLAGGSTTYVPLPIYFNPELAQKEQQDFTGAGRYERAIEVKIWGSDATVLSTTRPLRIVTPNLHALFVTVFAFVCTGAGLFLLLRFHQQLFSRFSTKQLILIALFGTTIFVAVSVPSTLFANLISALLGPIAFLITGLINEMLYYALLTSLLMLLPKSGVITLVSAVRLLLGGITLGLFTPMALVYTGVTVLLLEAGFLLTRKSPNVLIWAPVFGICDALAAYVDFQLSIMLYRLFYADWYIITRIFVDGFSYTFVGVLLGKRLGTGLWRVSE